MTCKYRDENTICEIYEIICNNPEENNPDNFDFNGLVCTCWCYKPIK